MLQLITIYTAVLQKENYKSFYLAFLRVAICCWLLKEIALNWSSIEILYGAAAFVEAKNSSGTALSESIFNLVKNHHNWFVASYILVILINVAGIGKNISAVLLFTFVCMLQKLNMSNINGGDIMARMILFYLIFADSYQHFVFFKRKKEISDLEKLQNLISNLAALSIMVQLCVAYFSAGITKLLDPAWLHGEATYYAMSMERYTGTVLNKYLVRQKWFDYTTDYATLLFEIFFPLLIWKKRFRKPLLLAGLVFHSFIYIFLMIYGFEVVFILTYGLFLPNQQCIDTCKKIASFFTRNKTYRGKNIPISGS